MVQLLFMYLLILVLIQLSLYQSYVLLHSDSLSGRHVKEKMSLNQEPVSEKIYNYCQQLIYWQNNTDKLGCEWADFLADDSRPNKEVLLNKKRKLK